MEVQGKRSQEHRPKAEKDTIRQKGQQAQVEEQKRRIYYIIQKSGITLKLVKALRFQTGGRHQTSPDSIRGIPVDQYQYQQQYKVTVLFITTQELFIYYDHFSFHTSNFQELAKNCNNKSNLSRILPSNQPSHQDQEN